MSSEYLIDNPGLADTVPEDALAPGPGWPALHADYGEVLRKLEGSAE